jgi:putative ABC transport system permease protein
MTFGNLLRTAWVGISANRLRAGLTSLGIMIGVASVIATLALGNGTRAVVEAKFRSLGSDQVQITAKYKLEDGERVPAGKILSYEDGLLMPESSQLIDHVEMMVYAIGRARHGKVVLSNVTIKGTMGTYLLSMSTKKHLQPAGWEDDDDLEADSYLMAGRFFTPAEILMKAEVCVLAYQTAEDLFEGSDPVGEIIRVNRKSFEVIGVLNELESLDSSQSNLSQFNEGIFLPVSTTIEGLLDEEPSVTIIAHVTNEGQMDQAKAEVVSFLRARHEIEQNLDGYYEDDFQITTKNELIGAQQEAARTFSFLLMALACVSLLVGGIGIMNVMLVSVTERMQEIGVRRAVGARRQDIALQFLVEALILSSVSGFLGLALGIMLVPISASLHQGIALLDLSSLPLSFGVALLTGVVFGLYPAVHASRMDPIMALRYE